MVKVLQQDRNHPLFDTLSQHFDMQRDITDTVVRSRPKTRSDLPRSVLSELGRHLFAHCVELWYAMAEEARQWYQDNAPPQFCTGFLWWTWSCLIKNYNAGPWTVNVSSIGGHCYIVPQDAPEGIYAKGYVDTTELGTLAHLDWEPGCREEGLPLLLVHGWYPEAFDPAQEWRVMAHALTGKDLAQTSDFALIYDPDRPGDESHALRFLTGQGLDVYISNYTHAPEEGTPGDIRRYAQSLAHEIEVLRSHKGAPAVDILSHSMGGIVARAYIENEDLADNPFAVAYRGDVFNLIMLAPPNQGTRWSNLYPGWWDWTSILQLEPDSDFLAQLNSGVTGQSKGVTYHVIAGNYYICLHIPDPTYTYHASRLCELEDNEPNDGELTVSQTELSKQGSLLEVLPENFHVRPWDHWEMRGTWDSPCDSATIVKIILAGYSLAKWRAKGKDIEPPEANYLQRCFNLIKRTDACHDLYDHIIDANITVEFRDLPTGTVAQWFPDDNTIGVDISAEALDEKVTSQHIIREAERSRWYNEDSISQQYHAFKAEADFWNAVKKGDRDDHCDWVAGFIAQGRHEAMEYIRTLPQYATLPEYSGVSEALTEAFRALEDRPTGYQLCLDAQRMGVQLTYHSNIRSLYGYLWLVSEYPFAYYDWEEREGSLYDTWQAESLEANVAGLAYLVKSATQNSPPVLDREYAAFMYMARIWRAIKGTQEHGLCDEVDFYMHFSRNIADAWIRSRYEYADFPKEWIPAPAPADGKLHVYFLDVGEGDGIFVVTPHGKKILIDGGPGTVTLLAAVGRHLAPWDRHFEALILTHADDDHITGQIPVLDRYYVDKVFDSGYQHSNPTYAIWMTLVLDKRISYNRARAGMTIDTGDGVHLTIFHPGAQLMQGTGADANNNSIVARLVYGDVSFLLTGDIEAEAEQALLNGGYPLESTVLKVPHHGADTSSTQAFLDAVNPQMAVISVGEDNFFDHPHEEVVERLEALVGSDHLYRTDYNGTIEMIVEETLCPVTFHPITVVPPMPGEGEPPTEPSDKININTASQAELETLPTIGPTLAQAIIAYRPYESIEEIMMVPGIGPSTFDKIKDLICVVPPEEPPEEPEEEEEEEGLSDEVYIQTCLDLVKNTDQGREYYDQLMASGVGIGIKELAAGEWGVHFPAENMIYLSKATKADGVKVGATVLVHEAEHTRWLGENSINQEYHAYKAQSEFWNAVKGSDQHEFLDWCAGMALQGKHEAMDWLRGFYPCAGMPDYSEVEWDISTEFGMYDDLPQGHPKCLNSQRMGVQVGYHHYTMGCFAWYFRDEPSGKAAVVDETWEEYPDEATMAALAYLLTRVEWDRPDSINQEYVAFKEMAETWNLVKGSLEHEFCDEVAEVMALQGSAPKDWIRNQSAYADLPEYGP